MFTMKICNFLHHLLYLLVYKHNIQHFFILPNNLKILYQIHRQNTLDRMLFNLVKNECRLDLNLLLFHNLVEFCNCF